MTESDRLHLIEALKTSGNALRQLSTMSPEQFQTNYNSVCQCLESLANLLQQTANLLEKSD
jgi:uncharacterized protein YukE